MNVLITGGAGFIGSHLVDRLIEEGHRVSVLDNLSFGELANIKRHRGDSSFRFLEGDIRNLEDVTNALEGVDYVLHEAAITSVPFSVKNPQTTMDVNVGGTVNLLNVGSEMNVERFVFASTCAVYGEAKSLPISEDHTLDPSSPYAESKLSAEEECLSRANSNGIETVILRYFNVYGPRQSGGSYAGVISKFLDSLRDDESPTIFGSGEQTRDFVHIKDVVKANMLALGKKDAAGRTFNVGSGNSVTVKRLFETIREILGKENIDPDYGDPRPGDILHSRADLTRANEGLGYEPEISLKKGLEKLIEKK